MQHLTDIELIIIKAAQSRTGWLNCSSVYLCEVFALHAKQLLDFREVDGQLQVRARRLSPCTA